MKYLVPVLPKIASVSDYYAVKSLVIQNKKLRNMFEQMTNNDGFISSLGNKLTGGKGKCEQAIQNHAEGKIDFKKVMEKLKTYKTLQNISVNMPSSMVAASAAANVCSAASTDAVSTSGILAVSALTGAFIKIALKCLDRAGNKIKGDAFNKNKMAEDMISGSFVGLMPQAKLLAQTPELLAEITATGITIKKTAQEILKLSAFKPKKI